ncbi:serine protease AprX [Silvibacterium bohemicum]|uniref:Serine protease AprX n=1 Tax=Silvibacterium bohemicum TaxID=1577686 RepID=A0A841JMP2_9BACT|nr:S8 family peptidase [Silvibacterium bohemicum]MBB6142626.1 serine protease AprX [Silvibacterium bohemicum]
MSQKPFRMLFVLGLLATCSGPVFAQTSSANSKISPDAAASSSTNLPIIVQYRNPPSSLETSLISLLGGLVTSVLQTIHALVATVPQSALSQIAADPNVVYISLDRPVASREAVTITAPDYTTQPINAPAVWQSGYLGTNIGVAVIDSGITPTPDLSINASTLSQDLQLIPELLSLPNEVAPWSDGRIVYSQNFVSGQNDALDHYGHGTHVAGLIAGNGAQSTGPTAFRTFYGSAPNANLINLRVLDQNGAGTDSSVIAAIQQAISLKNTFNIRIINLSLGRPIYESYKLDPLCQAVEQAWKAGIVVVVAAGNDGRDLNLNPEGYGTINAPGNDPYALTVGAMRTVETPAINDDLIASYSSKGPSFVDDVIKPDIVAPGNLVTSLEFSGDPLAEDNPSFVTPHSFYLKNGDDQPSTTYFPLSGTSMATGVTSGAVADLLQAVPGLTPDEVKALVMVSANREYFPKTSSVTDGGVVYNANYDVFTIGAGYLDISATVKAARVNNGSVPAGTAMSPIASYDPSTGNTTAVVDPSALWGKTTLFGPSSVYGNNAFIGSSADASALWGQTALWGKSDPDGYSALWGSTALWGKSTPEAQTALWGKSGTAGSSVPLEY